MKKDKRQWTLVLESVMLICLVFLLSGCQTPKNQNSESAVSKTGKEAEIENVEYHKDKFLLQLFFEDVDQVLSVLGYSKEDLAELSEQESKTYVQLITPVQFNGIDFNMLFCKLSKENDAKFAGVLYRTSFNSDKEKDVYNAMLSLFDALQSQYGEGDMQKFDMNFTKDLAEENFIKGIRQKHFYHDWDLETVDTYYVRLEATPIMNEKGVSHYEIHIFVGLGYQDPLRTDYSVIEEQVKALK